jgi:hypothetical protein
LALAFALLFAGIYWPVIRREEEYLRGEFGPVYDLYARRVPLFVPRFRQSETSEKFSWRQYLKNHEYEAFFGYLTLMIYLAFRTWLR